MSLQTRLAALVTAIGTDIKALNTQYASGQIVVPNGPTLTTGYLRLAAGQAVPANTPPNTLIIRPTS